MKLPDRWLPYKPMGERIPGTRFISFKVPLKEAYCGSLTEAQRFTPEMLMEQCPNVQLIVDLTNTSKYYNSNTFTDAGVAYKKILTPGHVIPARRYILEFFQTVKDFIASSDDDDSLIGVHCTHGLNRTSYFICCYMIHEMGFDPEDALAAFEKARGHKIERQNYVNDLKGRGMGSDSGQQTFVSDARERYGGPTGPGHWGQKQQAFKTPGNSRSSWQAQRDSRSNGPGHWNSRSNDSAHWNSRSKDPAHWNPRANGPGQRYSRPSGPAPCDSRSKGPVQRSRGEPRVSSQSDWRNRPDDRPSHDGNQRQCHFEEPSHAYPSSSRSQHTFFPFDEGRTQQRPQGNVPRVDGIQQYSTYKEWRAAHGDQRPPVNQQRVPHHGPRQANPKPQCRTIPKHKSNAESGV